VGERRTGRVITVLLADDHPVFREGARRILEREPDIRVVAETDTGARVLALIAELKPDILLLDISMAGPGHLAILRDIKEKDLRVRVLTFSGHDEAQYGIPALRAGAAGYISKAFKPAQLVEAVRHVHSGRRYVSADLAEQLAEGADQDATLAPHLMLAARELEVLTMMASGMSLKEIAAKLDINPKTVGSYRVRILEGLGVKTNAELVRYAVEHDLVRE
jgi:two-component system invasion response regulator UvrY